MKLNDCLQILREIKDVAFATVDENGKPQIRIIDIMLAEDEKVYFCTARGKEFYKQLKLSNEVAVTGMTSSYQMVRINGKARKLDNQKMWIDRIFEENPSINNVYPDDSRYVLEAFCIDNGDAEFFDLSSEPIVRKSFSFGEAKQIAKGYIITDKCINCGKCERLCPQKCISDFTINQTHCLHCGLCYEQCPVGAIDKL